MLKRTIVFVIAAAVFLSLSGATNASFPQDKLSTPSVPAGWTTPVNISLQEGQSEAPTLAVDDNGHVYATWTEWFGSVGAPRAMMFNSTDTAGRWGVGQGKYLNYPDIDDVGFPSIVCTPTDGTAIMAYHDGNLSQGTMGVFSRQFKNGQITGEGFLPGLANPASYVTLARNPIDGLIYAVFQYDPTDTVTFELALFTFNPATGQWSGGDLIHGMTGSSRYWPSLVFDAKGMAHLLYITRSPAMVYYTKSTNPGSGGSWTAPINLSGDTGRDWVAPRMAADKDGDVYVVWYGNTGGYESATEEVYFKKTVNGVWQSTENLTNNPLRSEGGSIAVNPNTKDIYLAYHENFGGSNWEVMWKTYETRANGVKSWSEAINLTESAGHSGEPCIKVDSKGGLHLVYHETMADGNMEILYTTKPGIVKPQPPLTILLDSRLDASETRKINRIAWANNPANAGIPMTSTKVFRKPAGAADSAFGLIGSVGPPAVQYEDLNLDVQTKYAYRLTFLAQSGDESDPSSTVVETKKFDFAPLNAAVQTRFNKILFTRFKVNTITFAKNPLNDEAEVSGYNVYRRKAEDGDDQFVLLTTLNASTLSYRDGMTKNGRLEAKQKYAYGVTTLFLSGRESGKAVVISQ